MPKVNWIEPDTKFNGYPANIELTISKYKKLKIEKKGKINAKTKNKKRVERKARTKGK